MNKKIIEEIYSETLMSLSDDTLKKMLGEDGWKYLMEYDEWFLKHSKEMKNEWKKKYLEDRKKEWEFIDENKEFGREARIRYLEQLKENINKEIEDEERFQEKMIDEDVPFWFRQISFERWKRLVRQYNKIKSEIEILKQNKDKDITLEMIERARKYPIDRIIEVNHNNFAVCPFHNDTKPSLYTRNNYFYCFGCGEHGDVIDLVMKLDGIDFKTAVKKLQNY